MMRYQIFDVWMAIRLAAANFVLGSLTVVIFFMIMGLQNYSLFGIVLVLLQSIFIYRANYLYLIDGTQQAFTFPSSDIENSILDILSLRPYWSLIRRKTVPLSAVENIYLDTQRWTSEKNIAIGNTVKGKTKFKKSTKKHVRYCLNVAGSFGSANLKFLSRQKRDEVRNALQQSIQNRKVDAKVAELA